MPHEYIALVLMTIFFLLAWTPSSYGKAGAFGWSWVASNRESYKFDQLPPWTQRCERAYNNLKDYFPGFVVAIVLLGLVSKFDHTTTIAAYGYLFGRILHYVAYALGNVTFRAAGFFIGMGCNLWLLVKVMI